MICSFHGNYLAEHLYVGFQFVVDPCQDQGAQCAAALQVASASLRLMDLLGRRRGQSSVVIYRHFFATCYLSGLLFAFRWGAVG